MNWLGGGVLIAVGAALWVAYLLPSMLRRRQLHQAELEAARLQEALHTLAETGELPAEELSRHERVAERKRQHKLERQVERENLKALHVAEHDRKEQARRDRAEERRSAEAKRAQLIRARITASWVLLLSFITIVGGSVAMFFGVTWMVAGAGVVAAVTAVIALRQVVHGLAALPNTHVATALTESQAFTDIAVPVATRPASRSWSPTPLPSPLHLAEGSVSSQVVAGSAALEALRRRARELAAEQASPSVQLPTVSAARARAAAMAAHPATTGKQKRQGAPAPANRPMNAAEQVARRYAGLDSFEQIDDASLDITEILQRRRAV